MFEDGGFVVAITGDLLLRLKRFASAHGFPCDADLCRLLLSCKLDDYDTFFAAYIRDCLHNSFSDAQ